MYKTVAFTTCLAVAIAGMTGMSASAQEVSAENLENPLKASDKNSYSLTLYQKMISFFPTEQTPIDPPTEEGGDENAVMLDADEAPADGKNGQFPSEDGAEEVPVTETVVYPEEYAGAYIDGSDNLHIKAEIILHMG